MLLLAWKTFCDRWQVFAGAIVTVCLGVALVQSSLLALISAATAPIPPELSEAEANALREAFEGALTLLGMQLALATFVAVFIVSSTFVFTVSQRRQELGLLRLTGADRRQVRSLLVGEAILLGLIGSALGIALGLPVMRAQLWMLDEFGFAPPDFEAQWQWWVILASLGIGVLIAVLGVLGASWRASKVRPMEALRESGQAARVMTPARWILGLLFTAGGVFLLMFFPGGDTALPDWFIQLTPFLVSAPLVIGFNALAPLMVPLVSRLFGLFFRGQIGDLALANLRFDAQRSAATAAPIMLLFAFIVSIGATLSSVSIATQEETLNTVQGDLIVTTDQPAAEEISEIDGVQAVSEETTILFEIRFTVYEDQWHEAQYGLAADPATYTETREVEATAGDLTDLRGAAIAVSPSGWERDWQMGDTLQIRLNDEEVEAPIVALLPETLSGPYFLLSPDILPPDAGPWQHIVQLAHGVGGGEVATKLSEFGTVETVDQWISGAAAEDDLLTLKIMVVLLGMTMLFTIIAMINAVVISASNRHRAFATARVTGLRRGQVVRMAFWESQAVVSIGLFLGGVAAAGSIVGVALAISHLIGFAVVSVPWPLVIGLAFGCALVVGVTSVVTTLSATRTPPIRLVASHE